MKEVAKDFPDARYIYCGSDNVCLEHANFYAKGIFAICESYGKALLQLDYDKSQKGQDQCEWETALARNALHNLVDQDNTVC